MELLVQALGVQKSHEGANDILRVDVFKLLDVETKVASHVGVTLHDHVDSALDVGDP